MLKPDNELKNTLTDAFKGMPDREKLAFAKELRRLYVEAVRDGSAVLLPNELRALDKNIKALE